jgi:predicted PurR-regulated permease PerM
MSGARRLAFLALVVLGIYFSYLVLGPFLVAMSWAGIFAILFRRTQVSLAARIGPNRSAAVVTVLTAVLIVAPVATLVTSLAREAPTVTDYLQKTTRNAPRQIETMWQMIRELSPVDLPDDPTQLLAEGARRAMSVLVPQAGAVVADALATIGALLVMLFALFFMLREGDAIGVKLRELLPLPSVERDRLLAETRDLVIASVGAGLLVAAAQGGIAGLAFWLLGLGAPVFWGVATGVCSLLPVVGAAVVWAPAGVWLLATGETTRGITMLVVGVLGISMVDNVLRPLLLSGRTSVSGFVVFFGLLGGAAAFGFIGLVIGPVILVTTGRLLEILLRPDLHGESS